MRPVGRSTLEVRVAALAAATIGAATLCVVLLIARDRLIIAGVSVLLLVMYAFAVRSVGFRGLERQLRAAARLPEGAERIPRSRHIAIVLGLWLGLGAPLFAATFGAIARLHEQADFEIGVSAASVTIALGATLLCASGVQQLGIARALERWERANDAVLWSEVWPLRRRPVAQADVPRRRFYFASERVPVGVDDAAETPPGPGILLTLVPLEVGLLALLGSFAIGQPVAAALLRVAAGIAIALYGVALLKNWRQARVLAEWRRPHSPRRVAAPWIVGGVLLASAGLVELVLGLAG